MFNIEFDYRPWPRWSNCIRHIWSLRRVEDLNRFSFILTDILKNGRETSGALQPRRHYVTNKTLLTERMYIRKITIMMCKRMPGKDALKRVAWNSALTL